MKQQIQEKTKDTVIQVIKEKENLVRDTVDKKKCMVIFGLQEKRNPVKMVREREKEELVRNIVLLVQDEEQGLEREIEVVYRIGKYKEGDKRPIKVKMRQQVVIEEILARTGKLAENHDYKNIWIKRDMNLEKRKREKELRNEAKEKKQEEDRDREERILLECWMRLRKWYLRQREEEMRGIQA